MMSEFKDFAVKGNVMDMAVGIIIGGAFKTIITSLVKDVIMPPVGLAMGGVDFNEMKYTLQDAAVASADGVTKAVEAVTVNYGTFLMTIIDFIILAFVIFMMVRGINSAKKKEEAAPSAPPAPSKEEVLLGEIRDLLKK